MTKPLDADAAKKESRGVAVNAIVNDLIARRTAGERVSDESLIERHPEMMPELADELRKLRIVESAEQHAESLPEGMRIRCPHCHNPVELVDDASLSEIVCPSCRSGFSLTSDTDRTFRASQQEMVNHFQLLDRVGIGAFGSVWSARDTQLDRIVALKIPRKGQLSPDEAEQFIREARAAAQLKHPNIVSVLEVGRYKDRIYIACDLVQGLDLADWLTDQQATPVEAAELCATVADALQHAHQQGVIHRDIKPSNIMLDTAGEPHLMDFGLAKRESGEMTMTVEGKLLGTPAYMPPEQARGSAHDADARSDVYSLGVILFELLTGERPFRGSTRMLLHQVLVDDAPSPRRLNSLIPRDLETICLKCLEKDPARRYQTAGDLRDDLRHFLSNEPVMARPITRASRAWRWCKRKPIVAALATAVVSLILFVGIGGSIMALRQTELAHRANSLADKEAEARDAAITREQEAKEARQLAVEEAESRRRLLYTSDTNLAMQAWEDANVERVVELLFRHIPNSNQEDLRGFEWYYLLRLCATSLNTPTLRHGLPFMSVAFSSRNKLASVGWAPGITVWENESPVMHLQNDISANSVAFSPDDKLLASGNNDNTVALWDVEDERKLVTLRGHSKPVSSVAFSPDGTMLASASGDNTIRLWDVGTHRQLPFVMQHQLPVNCVAFSPNGQLLASASSDTTVKLWDAKSGEELRILRGHRDSVKHVVFSRDGNSLVSGSADHTIKVWDASSGIEQNTLQGHSSAVRSVALSPDGGTLASGSEDRTVKLWNLAKGELLTTLKGHAAGVLDVAFTSDGEFLASASMDKTVKLWDVALGHDKDVIECNYTGEGFGFAVSPDHQFLAYPSGNQGKLRDLTNGTERVFSDANIDSDVAFSPDGNTLASANRAGTIDLWSVTSGQRHTRITGHEGRIRSLVFSPLGEHLASAGSDHIVKIWNVESGREVVKLIGHTDEVNSVSFSPDGRRIASGSQDNAVILWNAESGQLMASRSFAKGGSINSVAFSPDGQMIAASGNIGHLLLWYIAADKHRTREVYSGDISQEIAFSPNSKMLATGSPDGTIKLWDTTTLENRFTFRGHGESVHRVAFLSEELMASGSRGGQVRFWRAATAEQVEQLAQSDQYLIFLVDRGLRHGEFGEWDQAATDLWRAVDLIPHESMLWHEAAFSLCPLLMYLGEKDKYQVLCNRMMRHPANTNQSLIVERTVAMSLLGPSWREDHEPLVKMTDFALANVQQGWQVATIQKAKGICEYRRGRYESAVRWLENAVDTFGGRSQAWERFSKCTCLFSLAMAHHRLGQHDEARHYFREAHDLKKSFPQVDEHYFTPSWRDWLVSQLWSREAEQLIAWGNEKPQTTDDK